MGRFLKITVGYTGTCEIYDNTGLPRTVPWCDSCVLRCVECHGTSRFSTDAIYATIPHLTLGSFSVYIWKMAHVNGNFRIQQMEVRKRTIFQAICSGDIPLHRPE
jgi:hypothetical protein